VLIPKNIVEQVLRPDEPRPQGAVSPPSGKAAGRAVPGIQYWCENQADETLRSEVERAVNAEVRQREYARRGVEPGVVRAIEQTRVEFTSLNPKKEKGEEQVGMADRIRQWLPSVFVYLLWVGIFAIAQMLLNSVIEEKSNRIVEVLLSSVTPGELMMGKLAGIASTGLCMLAVWVLSFVGMIWWKSSGGPPAGGGGGMSSVPHDIASILQTSWLLPAFFLYFVLGYLMYAGLILALGSTCNTIKDAQNFMGVIVLFLMVPLFTMTFIPRDPNGPVATVLSWIPPYTPFVMMNRVTASPPMRDVIGTLLLLMVSTVLILWGAGRIFRIGILRTGQPPKLKELFRWLRWR
jgi:ABC-2 type transport system permease protein